MRNPDRQATSRDQHNEREIEVDKADRTQVRDIGCCSRRVFDQVRRVGEEPGNDHRDDGNSHHDSSERQHQNEAEHRLPPVVSRAAKHLLVHPGTVGQCTDRAGLWERRRWNR
jgi:hypothetical protein